MANSGAWKGGRAAALLRLAACCLVVLLGLAPAGALAADRAKLFATSENGYGRIILDFTDRMDLPAYTVHSDNGVLTISFAEPVDLTLPDVSAALPDYVSVARMDPDGRGVRFGLRTTLTLDHIEAGEKLFLDLLPPSWQGLPPRLPPEVISELAERAKHAALIADEKRKAEEAKTLKPVATLRVGRNPTFMRVEVQWNVDTDGKFAIDGTHGNLDFEWPVPIDTYLLKTGLPDEVLGVDNQVTADGSRLVFRTAEGVTPRFYKLSPRDYIVDIDTASTVPANPNPIAAATAKKIASAVAATDGAPKLSGPVALADGSMRWAALALSPYNHKPEQPVTPVARMVGSTVRISFPFDRETAAAVFRRGDSLWMLFDTTAAINQPDVPPALVPLLKSFTIVPTGDAQVVRLDLGTDKLATLGSEGQAWVLSIGDMLLAPTAPLSLSRRADRQGLYSVTANLDRPGKVHSFADPVVGDTLQVVTSFPPARGMTRELDYVDFSALRSVQGLVVRPEHSDVKVAIDAGMAVISAPGGLTVSPPDGIRLDAAGAAPPPSRDGFLDLASLEDGNPISFGQKVEAGIAAASDTDGEARQKARLDLAKLYVANDFGPEAIGVIGALLHDLKGDDMRRTARLALAAADVSAHRPSDALDILNDQTFSDDIDAHMWRAIAETDANSFASARRDAVASEAVAASSPEWVHTRFLLDAVRASLETGDTGAAEHFYKEFNFSDLDADQVTEFQLLGGRIAEAEGRTDEALDTYGQVIAADVRPTRAEAVYRTILILDREGKLNLPKATATLAAEALLWRGDLQEARMDQLLAELYFRTGQYRAGFETAKSAAIAFPS
ncbi:MAG TPA: hypothetical protein VHB74_13135, partial [Devosia sp.]|nr:hypothetical protein [Devosia sp.]